MNDVLMDRVRTRLEPFFNSTGRLGIIGIDGSADGSADDRDDSAWSGSSIYRSPDLTEIGVELRGTEE